MKGKLEIQKRIQELKDLAKKENINLGEELDRLETKVEKGEQLSDVAWKSVEIARMVERPGTLQFIEELSDNFVELHGDRLFGDDPALVGGIATINGQPVTFIGHQKGANMKENIKRNYGMAHPEGYRKALRLAKQAEKFGRPIITFIDTSGAYPGLAAEERGIGEAIARNLKEFSMLKTPVISFVIGEGGSGGALGIGVGDKLYMLENAVYSVISPEGCASILLRDATKAKDAASMMKMTSRDIKTFGLCNDIVQEVSGGVHKDVSYTAGLMKDIILRDLASLSLKSVDQLLKHRSKKFMLMGRFTEKMVNQSPDKLSLSGMMNSFR